MAEYQRVVLVHYHEIGLKGHNRSAFEKRLQKNLEALLGDYPVVAITRIWGRLVVPLREGTDPATALGCASFASQVPGVARVSTGYKTPREIGDIEKAALAALTDALPFETFKVQARRAHTDFPICSMDMNRQVGAVLSEAFPDKSVKMKEPDVQVGIEVVQNAAYVYAFSMRGIGGLPVGASGNVCCLLFLGDRLACGHLAHGQARGALHRRALLGTPRNVRRVRVPGARHRRRARPHGLHIEDIHHPAGQPSARDIPLCTAFSEGHPLQAPDDEGRAVNSRAREDAGALVAAGESLGQVASQTLDNIRCTDEAVDLPVFRPAHRHRQAGDRSRRRSAWARSSCQTQDAPDCCTLFMPRAPETHAKLPAVLEAESQFPVEEWVAELVDSAELHAFQGTSARS